MNIAEQIANQLGACVLISIPAGEKGPRAAGWQKLTQADMTPSYLASLNHGNNIGVLLGEPSGGLCSVDADNDEFLDGFLAANSGLSNSLISKGQRGGNVWLRIRGKYPPPAKLTHKGTPWGEWRADRNQTVFFGKHPSGCAYTNNGKRPICIDFDDIKWPLGMKLPWAEKTSEAPLQQRPSLPPVAENTDLGRAERFIARFGNDIRHVYEWDRWLVFEDNRWSSANNGAAHRLAAEICRESLIRALNVTGKDEREAAFRSALAWGNVRSVDNMLQAARNDRRVIVRPEELDCDPWLAGARNGVVDLRTGKITEHSRQQLVTKFVGADFDPAAKCPRWQQFLEEILEDEAVRRFVWKAAGYSLTGLTTEHDFLFLHGRGANGKSTFLEILCAAFGDYAGRAGPRLLYATDHHGTPDDQIAELFGRRLVIGSETQEGVRMQEGTLKDITGGDTLRGCRKYEHGFSFKSIAKLWLAGNHKPAIRGTDDGIWRRVRLIPFERQFGPGERDENLRAKLLGELPGILNWLVQGAMLWQKEGLTAPEIVRAAVEEYRTDEDTLADFLSEHIEREPGSGVRHSEVFERYQAWSKTEGINFALSSRGLAKRLRERGFQDGKDRTGSRQWNGTSLKHDG